MIATRLVLERSLAAFRDGGAPPASAADGRDVLEVIAAGYRSARLGRRVRLDGDDARDLATMQLGGPPAGADRPTQTG